MRDLLNREEVICLVIENNRTHGLEMTAFEFAYDNGCAVNIKHRRYVPNVAVGEIVRYKHATRTVNRGLLSTTLTCRRLGSHRVPAFARIKEGHHVTD